MRWSLIVVLAGWLILAGSASAQETPVDGEGTPTSDESSGQPGPLLQPADYAPVVCDPGTPGFRYLEVRGTGFDAWATQHLTGALTNASGARVIHWSSIWVSPQGRLTVEVNLCSDPIQKRPALEPGDYSVSVGDSSGATITSTGISVTTPPESAPAEGDQTQPELSATPAPTPNLAPTTATQVAEPPRTGLGSQQQPIPLGSSGGLVDGWQLSVQSVSPDAYSLIKASVPSAVAPMGDLQDVLLGMRAIYQGPGTGVFSSARLALLNTTTQQVYDQVHNACGVIPNFLPPNVVISGGSEQGNVCFTVHASDIPSLLLLDNQTSPADRMYFSLQ